MNKPQGRWKSSPIIETFRLGRIESSAQSRLEARGQFETGTGTGNKTGTGFFGSGTRGRARTELEVVVVEGTRESGGDIHVDAERGADQLVGVGPLEDQHK